MAELQEHTRANLDRADLSAQKLDFDAIPRIDVADLDDIDVEKRLAVAMKIRDAWTNDQLRSTLHRVVNLSGHERYSLVFFYGANYHTVIECLPACLGENRPAKYPPVRAGEWTIRNIQAAYAYMPNLV
jgi:hypothetical protein